MTVSIRGVGLVVTVLSFVLTTESLGSIGPYGGTVDLLAVDPTNPSVVYAGAEGLFKTTNQGESWSETGLAAAAQALDSPSNTSAVAINPRDSSILYAGIARLGVLKSTDGGDAWVLTGLQSESVNALAIDPFDPETIYAATEESGILKSTDGGGDWSPINSGLTIRDFLSLAIDPQTPGTVYAGSNYTFPASVDGSRHGFGVFKTTDGGQRWAAMGPRNQVVYSLAIDPLNPNRIYIAVGDPDEIYQTLDGGENWTGLREGVIRLDVECVAFDTVESDVLYSCTQGGGVYKTIDGGRLWLPTTLDRGEIKSLVVAGGEQPAVLAGASLGQRQAVQGVYKSLDSGQTWGQFNQGINRREITSIVVRPDDPDFIYVAADGRVLRTTNGGADWVTLSSDLPLGVLQLTLDPANPDILYGVGGTFYVSEDRGEHWIERREGFGTDVGYITTLAVDPTDSNKLYAGTFFRGVFKSTDRGLLWQRSGSPPWQVSALVSDPENPSTFYVGLNSGVLGTYAFKTTDGGKTWLNRSTGLPTWGVGAMLVDPTDSQIAYAGYNRPEHGIFKTTDGGERWLPTGLTRGIIYTIAIQPGDPSTLYAGTLSGVRKSDDGGQQWIPLGSGISRQQVLAIAIHPQDPRRLYAATRQSVFASDDGGETWH